MTNIDFKRGDHFDINYTILKLSDDSAVDLSSAEIIFSVKGSPADTVYTFQRKNTAAGGGDTEIEETDYSAGTFTVHIIDTNTSSETPGRFYFDLEITTSASKVYTADDGILIIKTDITI